MKCKPGYKKKCPRCKCDFLKKVGYNSHGKWSTLGEILSVERERGNPLPKTKLPKNTPAIWITFNKRIALSYAFPAEECDRISDPSKPLTKEEKEELKDIVSIKLNKSDKILCDDGDEGYLLARLK